MPGLRTGEKPAVLDLDVVDARARRAVAQRALEAIEGVGVALGERLNGAIGEVPDPPVQPFALSGLEGKVSKPDGLDAPGDQISPRDAHGR